MTARKRQDFSAFIARANGLVSRIITKVGISEAYDPSNPPAVKPPMFDTEALWDTGATNSCITTDFAAKLALAPTGVATVSHAGGVSQRPTYVLNFTLPNRVGILGVTVAETANSSLYGAIIGMDIITKGDLAITNVGGETTMSFRHPSIKEIDYVEEANVIKYYGIGRNAPCPCGSGKKLKQCCRP